MDYKAASLRAVPSLTPRLIIHGGAGNILPSNLPPAIYNQYHSALLSILAASYRFLQQGNNALDVVSFAVELLENNPLFNSGKGAVFTRSGTQEMEVSVMVSRGKKKRGVGIMGLAHVKNPVKLAREMLLHGEKDLEAGNGEHRGPMSVPSLAPPTGAQGHSQLFGKTAEDLARAWGVEMADKEYFFVQNRWDEHIKGLEREERGEGSATWDKEAYVSQGTCGAVCLDSEGVLAVATSTGGMTNKLPGRIGDTPTLGAGFWAEEWIEERNSGNMEAWRWMTDCLGGYRPLSNGKQVIIRGTAMSGTGNGDSFLRMDAVRTTSAIARYRPNTSLQEALTEMTGPGGDLQKSAGNRWKKTGEGEGGIVGIEAVVVCDEEGEVKSAEGIVVEDYNCGGMFRAMVDEDGKAVCRIWRKGEVEGVRGYEGEGRQYEVREWLVEKDVR